MIKKLAVLMALVPGIAFAGPDRISVLVGSRHVPSGNYEEFNPGIFLGWEDRRGNYWDVGAYRNSYGDVSVAGTYGWELGRGFSVVAGVAYYPDAERHFKYHASNLIPIAGVRYEYKNVFVQAIPGVIGFGLTWKLNGD